MATANIKMNPFELGDFGNLCKTIPMAAKKNIALVAHDNKKDELLEWAKFNRKLCQHQCWIPAKGNAILHIENDDTDQIHYETARQSRSALGIGLTIR